MKHDRNRTGKKGEQQQQQEMAWRSCDDKQQLQQQQQPSSSLHQTLEQEVQQQQIEQQLEQELTTTTTTTEDDDDGSTELMDRCKYRIARSRQTFQRYPELVQRFNKNLANDLRNACLPSLDVLIKTTIQDHDLADKLTKTRKYVSSVCNQIANEKDPDEFCDFLALFSFLTPLLLHRTEETDKNPELEFATQLSDKKGMPNFFYRFRLISWITLIPQTDAAAVMGVFRTWTAISLLLIFCPSALILDVQSYLTKASDAKVDIFFSVIRDLIVLLSSKSLFSESSVEDPDEVFERRRGTVTKFSNVLYSLLGLMTWSEQSRQLFREEIDNRAIPYVLESMDDLSTVARAERQTASASLQEPGRIMTFLQFTASWILACEYVVLPMISPDTEEELKTLPQKIKRDVGRVYFQLAEISRILISSKTNMDVSALLKFPNVLALFQIVSEICSEDEEEEEQVAVLAGGGGGGGGAAAADTTSAPAATRLVPKKKDTGDVLASTFNSYFGCWKEEFGDIYQLVEKMIFS